ncbi:RimJ/RimL family protein N-acetyltransferase [Streptomyces sp. PvR006]|uniref:GNAT family N-acetyltransferase n=1 Tax=Streptomyces sp. PvR006 TaxID=2817860 RepID=UPI001AE98986|nr:GNAT family N-acetyltransferase [Streptomyces sp. PvR006]MBP2581150.1 RimJ/RimL family protein N-acetyltransferase [Streptomyces sp. PvR006]
MTSVRPARPNELPALVEHPGDPERNAATRAYLAQLLDSGCTRPEWCLVAEDGDGRLTGSVVLWTVPGHEVPLALVLFEAPEDAPETAAALLDAAAVRARELGATELEHVVDSPAQAPQFQRNPEHRGELLRASGYAVLRDGRRFGLRLPAATGAGGAGPEPSGVPDGLPADDPRLTFRSLAELGPEPFVAVLAELLADTADARLAADVRQHGARRAAELLFEETAELKHEPAWWELGYDADGSVAVISLPAENPSVPVIGFVGVAPAHRGKGYATSVVVRGTRVLAGAGATEIRGDCDAANVAMAKAFERAGYVNFADRLEFGRAL